MLREQGYAGRLRAVGGLIADQYAMARRVGFDEVRISAALAARQPQEQWTYRADWQDWDHRSRLAGQRPVQLALRTKHGVDLASTRKPNSASPTSLSCWKAARARWTRYIWGSICSRML